MPMDFKIDTKETFTVITPQANQINAILAEQLANKCEETRQNGSNNFIVDLTNANSADDDGIAGLVQMHEDSYNNNHSLVFTGVGVEVMNKMKENEADLLLNIAPKMIEAIDIISMEILERDLMSEE